MARIAGIGTRDLADAQIDIVEKLGEWIVRCGHELHSGNAQGSDQAFARGGNRVDPTKVHLHLPWLSYERQAIVLGNHVDILASLDWRIQSRYLDFAAQHHPAWERVSKGGRMLHARNGRIIYPDLLLNRPVDLVIAWPSGKIGGGGTGQGMRMAEAGRIPLLDLSGVVHDYLEPPIEDLRMICETIREMK